MKDTLEVTVTLPAGASRLARLLVWLGGRLILAGLWVCMRSLRVEPGRAK